MFILNRQIIRCFILFLLLFKMSFCFAKGISSPIIIDQPTTYKNMTIDLDNQSYYITNNATLDIENCIIINGMISPENPTLFNVSNGKLIFKNNIMNVKTNNIIPNPNIVTPFHVFTVNQGNVIISFNKVDIDQPFSVSILMTGSNSTRDFVITDNYFKTFHGGLFLDDTQNAYIANNNFFRVSGANIFINHSAKNAIEKNTIFFSGNNNVGDAVDILDSTDTVINKNYIANSSCYSILIFNCRNANISDNDVVGGITYAIYIATSFSNSYNDKYLSLLYNTFKGKNPLTIGNSDIIVTHNYLSQNRFGLTVRDTTRLTVINNYFMQHFSDAATRQFWTDNNTLIKNTSQIIWKDNFYKEAFTQVNGGDNSQAQQFVIFPEYGGVVL